MEYRIISFEGYKLYYRNFDELQEIYHEVFVQLEYDFKSMSPHPTIVDCGSHIGISILYFKKLYPNSKIIAFEPDRSNFILLQKNIEANDLKNISLINAAVSGENGTSTLFGEFDKKIPRTAGNSLIQAWANPGSIPATVSTVKLSKYIDQPVDFLKLDVEGVEDIVIKEVENNLHFVQELCIEFHGMNEQESSRLDKILFLLQKHHFITNVHHKKVEELFPQYLLNWAMTTNLSLAVIRASKKS